MTTLPNLNSTLAGPLPAGPGHPPRILLLYGSTRPRSFSRLLVEEAARLLRHFGADTHTIIVHPDAHVQPIFRRRHWCHHQHRDCHAICLQCHFDHCTGTIR